MTNAALSGGLAASSLAAWDLVSLILITVKYFQMCLGGMPAKPAKALLLVLQVWGSGPFEIIRLLCDVLG